MHIIGVDFSGAGNDAAVRNTWITRGELDANILTLSPPDKPGGFDQRTGELG